MTRSATTSLTSLVPFTVTIPPEERDTDLGTKLRAELEGIFAWAVRGGLAWQ
jgi:putative DNA primase/helicase